MLSLSLYYWNMPHAEINRLEKAVRLIQKKYRGSPIIWKKGKKIWNVVLTKSWNKGKAALLLIKHMKNPFPVAIGDDRTDWDMFRAIGKRGITIQVGMLKNSRGEMSPEKPCRSLPPAQEPISLSCQNNQRIFYK
jgi:trehalose-6-phosphatase